MSPRVSDSGEQRGPTAAEPPCDVCGSANAPERRFCAYCGANLWLPCPSCSAEGSAADAFCGSCGANLDQIRRDKAVQCEALLAEVAELAGQREYHRALSRLTPLARLKDIRLRRFREQGAEWTQRLEAEMQQATVEAERACAAAAEHFQQYDYGAAVEVLETVPSGLRHEPTVSLLERARTRCDEVRRLVAQVAESAKAGRLEELSALLDRLLALQPAHEKAQRLAGQLRDRQIRAAREHLATCEYRRAVADLEMIPSQLRNEEVNKLAAEAAELDWLMSDVESAAFADANLQAVAERLVKLRPDDASAAQRLTRIRSRLGERPRDARLLAPDWTNSRSVLLGVPVDHWALPKRLAVSVEVGPQLRRWPGRFWVACGLALQGIDRAVVAMNFAPPPSRSILQRLSRRSSNSAWGIDLGWSALKAVKLVAGRDPGAVTLEQAVLIEYEQDLLRIEDPAACEAALAAALRSLLEQHSITQEPLCLGLAGSQVLGRFVRLPAVIGSKRLDAAIALEARQQLPLAMEDLVWGHHVFPLPDGVNEEDAGWQIVLQAAKRRHVQEILQIADAAGARVDILTSNCLALHNVAAWDILGEQRSTTDTCPAVAVLEIGHRGADLVISSQQSVWTRHIGLGGDVVASNMARHLRLTRTQAEQLKRTPLRARRMSQLYGVIDPLLAHLCDELQRSFHLHARRFPGVTAVHLFGTGGGSQLHGLFRRLRNGNSTRQSRAAEVVQSV